MTDGYRIRSEETWNDARDDYLAGFSAEEVCRRYDIGLSALRRRARVEAWRRADHVDPEVADDLSIFEDIESVDLVEMAWSRLAAAVARGQGGEASRWMRIHARLHADAQAAAEAERWEADTAAHLATLDPPIARVPTPRLSPAGRNVHDLHSNFSDAGEEGPNSRQVRRRLEREARKRS